MKWESDQQAIDESLKRLEQSGPTGARLAEVIREKNVTVKFVKEEELTDQRNLNEFDPQRNEIHLSEGLRTADSDVIASHLAHEGTHAEYHHYATDTQTNREYIDEEFEAYKNQAEIWQNTHGDKTNFVLDENLRDFEQIQAGELTERQFKDELKSNYDRGLNIEEKDEPTMERGNTVNRDQSRERA